MPEAQSAARNVRRASATSSGLTAAEKSASSRYSRAASGGDRAEDDRVGDDVAVRLYARGRLVTLHQNVDGRLGGAHEAETRLRVLGAAGRDRNQPAARPRAGQRLLGEHHAGSAGTIRLYARDGVVFKVAPQVVDGRVRDRDEAAAAAREADHGVEASEPAQRLPDGGLAVFFTQEIRLEGNGAATGAFGQRAFDRTLGAVARARDHEHARAACHRSAKRRAADASRAAGQHDPQTVQEHPTGLPPRRARRARRRETPPTARARSHRVHPP